MADNLKGINFPNYFKNVAKSVAYTSSDIVKRQVPALDQYKDTNNDLIRATVDGVKNINRTVKTLKDKLDRAPVSKDVRDIIKNAMSDAATGKWHNKQRIDSADIFGLGANDPFAAGFDESVFDSLDMGDKKSKSKSKSKRSAATEINQTNIVNNVMQGANFERQAGLSVKLSRAEMANADKNANVSNVLATKFHRESVSELRNINTNMATVVGFSNDTMNPFIQKSLAYYEETTNLQRQMTALLRDSTEIQKMLVRNTLPQDDKQSDYEKVMGYNGIANFKEYGKVVGNNALRYFENSLGISMDFLKGMGGNPLKEFAASPLSFMAKAMAHKMIPDFFKAASAEFDSALRNFGATFMMKMGGFKNSDNPIMKAIGNIFGLDTRAKKTVNLGMYEKGPVPFDGITRKAIVDVIPTYLSKIHAAVAGLSDELVMNYDKGQMQWRSDMKRELDLVKKNAGLNSFSEFNESMEKQLSAFSFASQEEESKLREDFKEITRYLRDNLQLYNPTNMTEQMTEALKRIPGMSGSSVDFHKSLTKNMKYTDIRKLASGQVEADQRRSRDMRWYEQNASLTGMAQTDIAAGAGTIRKALSSTDSILTQIRRILVQGIIVFPRGGFGGKKGSASLNQNDRDMLRGRENEEQAEREKAIRESNRAEEERQALIRQRDKQARDADKRATLSGQTVIGGLSGVDNFDDLVKEASSKQDQFDRANKRGKYAEKKKGMFADIFDGADTFFQKTQKLYENPFKVLTSLLGEADKKMYQLIYGKDADPNGDQEEKGVIENMAHKIRDAFLGLATNFKAKVVDRLVDKFLNPMWDKVEDKVFKPLGAAWGRGVDHMFGIKGQDGKRIGGVFGGVRDDARDTFGSIKDFFIKGDDSVWGEMKGQVKGITRGMGDYLFGKGTWMTDKDGKQVLFGRERGGLFTSIGDGLKDFGAAMFGDSWREKHGSKFENLGAQFKKWLPSGATGAGLGILASMFLPGGPLVGAAVGATLNIARKSGHLDKMLFGDDKNSGLFGKRFNESFRAEFKGKARKITAGAGLGYIGGMFLPGGPITGALIGAGLVAVKNSETLQKALYGEKDVDGNRLGGLISKEFQAKFPAMKTMAGVGILGSMFLPGGPVAGAAVGALLGAVGSNKGFKRFLWGDYDAEKGTGKRGIFQRLGSHLFTQITAPFKNFADVQFEKMRHTLTKHVMNPIRQAMAPIGTEVKRMFKGIGDKFSGMLNSAVGTPILRLLTFMLAPVRKLGLMAAGGIAKSLRGAISLPGRGLRMFSGHLTNKQIMRGDLTFEEAQERFANNNAMDDAEKARHEERMGNVKARRQATDEKVAGAKADIKQDWKMDKFEKNVHAVAKQVALADPRSQELRDQIKEAHSERSPFVKRIFMKRDAKQAEMLNVSKKVEGLHKEYSDHLQAKRQEIIDGSGLYDNEINSPVRRKRGADSELGPVSERGAAPSGGAPQWKYEQDQMAKTDAVRESDLEKHLAEQAEKLRSGGAKSVGENVVLGIVEGIYAKRPELEAAVEKLGLEGIKQNLEEKLDIHSPSRVMVQIGKFITEGLVKGINQGEGKVKDAIEGVVPDTEKLTAKKTGGLFGAPHIDNLIGHDAKQQRAEAKENALHKAIIDTASYSKKTSEGIGGLLKGLFGKAKNAFGFLGSILGFAGKFVTGLLGLGPIVASITGALSGVKGLLTTGLNAIIKAILGKKITDAAGDVLGGGGSGGKGKGRGRGRTTRGMGRMAGKAFLFGAGMNLAEGIMSGEGVSMSDVTDAVDPRMATLWAANGADNMAKNYLSSGSVGHRYVDVLDEAGARTGRVTTEKNIIGKTTDAFFRLKDKVASTSVGGKIIAGASSAVKSVGDAGKDIWRKFSDFLKSEKVKKVIPEKVIKAITECIPRFATKITGKAAATLLAKIVSKFTPFLGPALIANDFVTGMTDVKRIFEIPPDSEPSWGMRMASGVSRLVSGFTFGLIDERWLAELMYGLLAGTEGKAEMEHMQETLKTQATDAGFGEDSTGYSDVMNKGLWQKVGAQFGLADTKRAGVKKEISEVKAQLQQETDPAKVAELQGRLDKLNVTQQNTKRTWWEATGDGLKGAGQWGKNLVGGGVNALKGAGQWGKNLVGNGVDAVKDWTGDLSKKADEFFGKIKGGFDTITGGIGKKFSDLIGNPLKSFASKVGGFVGGIGDRVNELGAKIKDKWKDVKSKLGNVVETAGDYIKTGVDKAREKAGDVVDTVKSTASSWWQKGKSLFGLGGPIEDDPGKALPSNTPISANGVTMKMPIGSQYPVTSPFGPRTHPVTGQKNKMHKGVDWGAPSGTPVLATADGTVVKAGVGTGYGNVIYLDHGNGITSRYGHLSAFKVKAGDVVKAGQEIGSVGNTGVSSGPHLHFEIRKNDEAVNPLPYVKGNTAMPITPTLTGTLGPSTINGDPAANLVTGEGGAATAPGSGNPFLDLVTSIGGALSGLITGNFSDPLAPAAGAAPSAVPGAPGVSMDAAGNPISTPMKMSGNKAEFINKIAPGAIKGFKEYGVLPSLTLAQGALESGWGKSAIGNNLFGIKAGKKWKGMTQMVNTHEVEGGVRKAVVAKFRDYPTIDDSVADHAKLLSGSLYKDVIAAKNYREATLAVKKAGYATDPNYTSLLNGIIESNGLMQYDKQVGRGGPVEELTGKGGPIESITTASKVNTENTGKIQASLSSYQAELTEKINKSLDAEALHKSAISRGGDIPWEQIVKLLEDIGASNRQIAGNTSTMAESSKVTAAATAHSAAEGKEKKVARGGGDSSSTANFFLGKSEQQKQRADNSVRQAVLRVASGK